MDSDDDYQSFSALEEPSPQVQHPRLKRLKKKSIQVQSDPLPDSIDDLLSIPRVDFAKLEAIEASKTKSLDSHFDDFSEPLLSQSSSDHETETEFGFAEEREGKENALEFDDKLVIGEDRRETKRALEFDDVERNGESKSEKLEKKRIIDGALSDKDDLEENIKKKNKRTKSESGDESKSRASSSNKRKQEKERKVYLQQLHAESQRLLRETRDASFKPIPVVSKPISSVLEKIRRRKLELSKKLLMLSNASSVESSSPLRSVMANHDCANMSAEEKEDKLVEVVEEDSVTHKMDAQNADVLDMDKSTELVPPSYGMVPQTDNEQKSNPTVQAPTDDTQDTEQKSNPTVQAPNDDTQDTEQKSSLVFRAPIDDTQDLFGDSEPRDNESEMPDDRQDSPLEDVFIPSLHSMNLKFDSVPSNDSASEEDNDKENVDPFRLRRGDDCSSPKGDPVKAFVDEEAEEEDDSDNDLLRFRANEEEEDMEDYEELNDIIATDYKEKPIDNERRNELHQKWLEQQDAVGTDNLLQRLKVRSKQKENTPLVREQEDSEDGEEYNDEIGEDTASRYPTRINLKKAKQIITQMFVDKEDLFLSDEDEEPEKKLLKHRLLVRTEEQAALVSPLEDESSREVFGLIKKLNIAPESRKRAKASSYLDSVLKEGNGKSFSKSSFLGRLSNHPLLSSHKKGSGTVRSFIFGRDDSNSRSSLSVSDDSSDTISKENQPIQTVRATLASSQAKIRSQYRNVSAETASGTSLFEILKRSSIQSSAFNHDDPVDLTHVMANFKLPKKPTKIERS